MSTETTVTRFVTRTEIVIPHPTLVKSNEEAKDYIYQRAGNGHYVCVHGDTAHLIIKKGGLIGCSCGDWTHRCKDNEGCKHIADFLKRQNSPAAKLDKRIAFDLIAAGWRKTEHGNLYPPDRESAAEAREKDIDATMDASWNRDDPEKQIPEVIAELDPIHQDKPLDIGVSEDAPAPQAHTLGMMSTNCQWCGKKIIRKLAPDLKRAIEQHEKACPKRPKEQKTEQIPKEPQRTQRNTEENKKMKENTTEPQTAVSTGRDMPDERTFTTEKVRRYVENRGGFYKAAGGKEVPDSAAMSMYALDSCHISTETILIEKDADQAKAIVRGHKGDVSVDASVILRFEVLKRRELLKMAKKYPKAISGWSDQLMPNLDLNFVLKDRTPVISLGEHMINFATDQEQFAERTAETLARRRVFDMLTGVDWRDAAEVATEDADAASMSSVKE